MERIESEPTLRQQLKTRAGWILGFVILIWALELVNLALGHRLCAWGIRPRTAAGLPGILLSPFLHCGLDHVLLNTMPFIVLGWLVILRGTRAFLRLSLFIILLGGAGIWLFGRPAHHVGASGLIFGYFGFLVARAWVERSLGSVLVAFLTILLYGSILWGVLPVYARISWEGHLFGLLAGILAARLLPAEARPGTTPSATPPEAASHAALLKRLDEINRELDSLKPQGRSGDDNDD
jgi:membrane associated rhomboid family serine protease